MRRARRVPGRVAGGRAAGRAARDAASSSGSIGPRRRSSPASASASRSRCSPTQSATRSRSARSSPARWSPSRARSTAIEQLVQPVRDMFAAVFFVSVGMLIDPMRDRRSTGARSSCSPLVVDRRASCIGVTFGAFLAGNGTRTSIARHEPRADRRVLVHHRRPRPVARRASATSSTRWRSRSRRSPTLTTPWLIRASTRTSELVDRKLPKPLQTFVAFYGAGSSGWRSRAKRASRSPACGGSSRFSSWMPRFSLRCPS